ncbi:MAG: hypothetical protein QXD43_02335, partial [Candidatus Aenigmatarchaeota archaeon]
MKIFSNGQFDINLMEYVFDSKKEKFIPKHKIDLKNAYENLKNSPRLLYLAHLTHDSNVKQFAMILSLGNKIVKIEEGAIFRQNDNKYYYEAIK